MAIPQNITITHIQSAIDEILSGTIDTVEKYFINVGQKKIPIKQVIRIANKYANGSTLNEFNSIEALNYLEKNAYTVYKNEKSESKEINIWIEKTIVEKRIDRLEGDRALGKALWSPREDKRGADIYKYMRDVKKGDIVLHLVDNKHFEGVSVARGTYEETEGLPNTEWDSPAYLVHLERHQVLQPNLDRDEILNAQNKEELIKISKDSEVFYNKDLNLRQGAYLTPCPYQLFLIINNEFKKKSGVDLPYIEYMDGVGLKEIEKIVLNQKGKKMDLIKIVSIKTKPFIILAGLSGTGKSRLVRTLAYQFNNIDSDKESELHPPSNYQLVKVKPNWHDSSDLLGYESRISGEDIFVLTDFIRFVVKALHNPDTPFFLCLDEMNLAPIEQYFAEYLSVIETRRVNDENKIETDPIVSGKLLKKYANKEGNVSKAYDLWDELGVTDNKIKEDLLSKGLCLPSNLIVMGTVNMDETTHSFSRKVLDRAMTLEMNEINLSENLANSAEDWDYPLVAQDRNLIISEKTQGSDVFESLGENTTKIIEYLTKINEKLDGTPFKIAYRVRDEFLLYGYNYSLLGDKPENWLMSVLDDMTLMKILPRIEGDEEKTSVLTDLIQYFEEMQLVNSLAKAKEMDEKRIKYRYTSFWS